MKVTIKDVAARAGVSPSTVSRVILENAKISQDTVQKVKAAIEALNYHPNMMAKSLVSQSTKTVAAIFPGPTEQAFSNIFFNEAIRGIIDYSSKHHYDVVISSANTLAELQKHVVNLVRGKKVDGLIVISNRIFDNIVQFLTDEAFPFVIIGNSDVPSHYTVDNDNVSASYDVTMHLINQGHTAIGFIGGPRSIAMSSDRYMGYSLALEEAGIPVRPEFIFEYSMFSDLNFHEIPLVMSLDEHPTAFVTLSDDIAFGVIQKCSELGLKVPEDVAVVSFNNTMISQISSPPITSMEIGIYQLGYASIFTLLRILRGEEPKEKRIIVPHRLMVRESSITKQIES
jgi:DNA-binding LacI/PurR family transcriptional regulator